MIEVQINGYPFPHTSKVFSGGEVHVKLGPTLFKHLPPINLPYAILKIIARLKTPTDVLELLMVTDALRQRFGRTPISLVMPYIPYARQDRVCDDGEALSIKVFANLINSQDYQEVEVWDPHSDVATALINHVKVVDQSEFVRRIILLTNGTKRDFVLIAPDAGALKKVSVLAKKFDLPMIRADKTRDVKTNNITGTVVYGEYIGKKDFLIVDDICDGGRTFNQLAEVLAPLTDGEIHLYVTHGIFSNGFNALKDSFDMVWVANSFVDLSEVDSFVRQI